MRALNSISAVPPPLPVATRRALDIDGLAPGRIYFQRYLIIGVISEQGGMSTTYRGLDLKALKQLDYLTLSAFGLGNLKRTDISRLDKGEVDPRSLGLKIDLEALRSTEFFRDCRVVLKCAGEAEPVKYLNKEIRTLYDLTKEERPFEEKDKKFPGLVGYGAFPHSSPNSDGYYPTYLAMREVGNMSLRKLMINKNITLFQVLDIFEQLLTGLKRMQRTRTANNNNQGYIHRDIKWVNIRVSFEQDDDAWIKTDLSTKLIDFGITSESGTDNDGKTIAGTSAVMAPELFQESTLDIRVDIYSLGILLYQLIAYGENPMAANDNHSTIHNQLRKEMPHLPPEAIEERFEDNVVDRYLPILQKLYDILDGMIQGMTKKDKEERFGDVDKLLGMVAKAKSLAKILEKEETYGMIVSSQVKFIEPTEDPE